MLLPLSMVQQSQVQKRSYSEHLDETSAQGDAGFYKCKGWQAESQLNTSSFFPVYDSNGGKAIRVTSSKQFSFFKLHLRPKTQRQVRARSCSLRMEALRADFCFGPYTIKKRKTKMQANCSYFFDPGYLKLQLEKVINSCCC